MPRSDSVGLELTISLLTWLSLLMPGVRGEQPANDGADWPMYNHDLRGWRFNPAEKTLSPANVGKLVEKWRFPAADSKDVIGVAHATPTVVAGEVYFKTATFPAFYKLGRDGKQLWVYRNPVRKTVLPPTDGAPGARTAVFTFCAPTPARSSGTRQSTPGRPRNLRPGMIRAYWRFPARWETCKPAAPPMVAPYSPMASTRFVWPRKRVRSPLGRCRPAVVSRRPRWIWRPNTGGTNARRSRKWAGTPGKPMYRDVGDVVASGIAVGNGVAYFTAIGSGKLIALDASTGKAFREIEIGPVFSGPSLSRGRVYVGGGNTLFTPSPLECLFPKKYTGSVQCFGLPGEDEAGKQGAANSERGFKVPGDVTFRTADIMSEGTRMAAEVFAPMQPQDKKLPTIVMSHGWGGTTAALRADAIVFAQAGYLVVAFDYRGWGNSDSRLVAVGKPKTKDGKLLTAALPMQRWRRSALLSRPQNPVGSGEPTYEQDALIARQSIMAEVKEVREVVDPIDQTTDILNAIHWVAGENQCDRDRIGIWGSSLSGGHVVYVAARDPRVKAFVSQVGAVDGRWVLGPSLKDYTFSQAAARTHGQLGYPKPREKFGTLNGAPVIEKFVGHAPIEDIGRCKDCAKLFIIAEKEELFDNKDHAILAHERATGVKKLVTMKGIKHYGIYNEARGQAQKEAIAWFDEYLKKK